MHRHGGLYPAGITVAWLLGVAWQLQQQAVQPIWGTALLLLVAALPCTMLEWRWRRGALLGVLAASLAGFAASDLRASLRLADALATALEGEDLVLTGFVAAPRQFILSRCSASTFRRRTTRSGRAPGRCP
jgi:competence protein ComEC